MKEINPDEFYDMLVEQSVEAEHRPAVVHVSEDAFDKLKKEFYKDNPNANNEKEMIYGSSAEKAMKKAVSSKRKSYKYAIEKGKRNERKTRDYFQKLGFVVQNTMPASYLFNGSYRRNNNDFFGLWDHIAVAIDNTHTLKMLTLQNPPLNLFKDYLKGETVFIQTKTNDLPTKKYLEELEQFPATNKLLVVWKDKVRIPDIYYLQELTNMKKFPSFAIWAYHSLTDDEIIEEYNKIQAKTSELSKSQRDIITDLYINKIKKD